MCASYDTISDDAPPVIDLSTSEEELVDQVKTACQRWGFFQITAHGIKDELRDRFESMMRAFFALPEDDKAECERPQREVMALSYFGHVVRVLDQISAAPLQEHSETLRDSQLVDRHA